jgi:preprotein translocase subunit SecG
MGLFHFLIVVQGLIAAALVGIILMQRSEGGGLGAGGSPSGLMSARGAADFMTRTTTVLATIFIALSVALAFVAAQQGGGKVDETFKRNEVVAPAQTPTSTTQQTPALTPASPGAAPVNPAKAPVGNTVPLDK